MSGLLLFGIVMILGGVLVIIPFVRKNDRNLARVVMQAFAMILFGFAFITSELIPKGIVQSMTLYAFAAGILYCLFVQWKIGRSASGDGSR